MTNISSLFKTMLGIKARGAYITLLFQMIAAIIATTFSMLNHDFKILMNLLSFFIGFAFFALFVYFVYAAVSNERINSSQTWRLVPISDTKFYLTNLVSAVVGTLYLILLQVIIATILFIPILADRKVQTYVHIPAEFW